MKSKTIPKFTLCIILVSLALTGIVNNEFSVKHLDYGQNTKTDIISDMRIASSDWNLTRSVGNGPVSVPAELIKEEERFELLKYLSKRYNSLNFFDGPKELEIEEGLSKITRISQIHPGKVYLIKGYICEIKSIFIHTICIQCRKDIEDCSCQDNGNKKELLILHIGANDDEESIDCLFLGGVAEKLVQKKVEQIINKAKFFDIIDSKLIGMDMYIQGKAEWWENLKRLLIMNSVLLLPLVQV